MRFVSSALAFVSAAAVIFGCSVYDSELVQSAGGLTGAGHSGTSTAGVGGTESGSAGSTSSESGNNAGGSVVTPEAGAADGGDGVGGAVSGGTAGSAGGAMGGTTTGGSATGGMGGAAGKGGAAGSAGMGGNAGSGGGATVAMCSDHPIPAKTSWTATASRESLNGVEGDPLYNPAKQMVDNNYTRRWSTGEPQAGSEWIQIDFGKVVNLTGVTLSVRGNQGDYPRLYVARMSNKPKDFAAPVLAMGDGKPPAEDPETTTISFSSMGTGQFLTVRQTGAVATGENSWWTITELLVSCENL